MKKTITLQDPQNPLFNFTIKISTEGCVGKQYFSITANAYRRGGCLHDEILELRPDLKPFVDLHSSDLDGVPMHAVANGFYWLCKIIGIPQQYEPEQDENTCFKYLMKHMRMNPADTVEKVIRPCAAAYVAGKMSVAHNVKVSPTCAQVQHKAGLSEVTKTFAAIVETQKPRWKSEADEAIKQLESLS